VSAAPCSVTNGGQSPGRTTWFGLDKDSYVNACGSIVQPQPSAEVGVMCCRDILHIGPQGLGVLRSAPALGALTVGVVLAYRPLRKHAGRATFVCVALFGVAQIVFGISTSFTISLLALAWGAC
jgi:hypothetical protein